MKRLLLLILVSGFSAFARVSYFDGPRAHVPDGEVCAVEVRCTAGKTAGSWRVSWPGVNLQLTLGSDSYVDGVDRPSGFLEVNGVKYPLKGNIDPGGANTLSVEWGMDSIATISVGHRELQAVTAAILSRPEGEVAVEPLASPFDLIDLIIETNPDSFGRLETGMDSAEVAAGRLWRYLDRDGDSRLAVVGGQYSLSQVGYDLIYIEGAKTNPGNWKPGMVKGRLIPTGFDGYYKLQWFDATGRELSGENYAEVDSDLGTLKLTFPQLKTSVRFHD